MQRIDNNPALLLKSGEGSDLVRFYFNLNHMKQIYRRGWLERGVGPGKCETVAEHSFGVALLCMILADELFPELDMARVLQLALLHDVGEIDPGDITPALEVPADVKSELEEACIRRVFAELKTGQRFIDLWTEYEFGASPEARFVRQVETLEMALQASVYACQGHSEMGEFCDSAVAVIKEPAIANLARELKSLFRQRE